MQITNPFLAGVDVTLALYSAPNGSTYSPEPGLWTGGTQAGVTGATAGNSYPVTFGARAATLDVSAAGVVSLNFAAAVAFTNFLVAAMEVTLPVALTRFLLRPVSSGYYATKVSHNRTATDTAPTTYAIGDTVGAWGGELGPLGGGAGSFPAGTLLSVAFGWLTSSLPTLDTQTLSFPGTFYGAAGGGQ